MKQWYQSKLVWLGIIQLLIGTLSVISEFLAKADYSPVAVTMLMSGILVVVMRIYFTDTQISK